MGKVANITIENYKDNFDIYEIYEAFLSLSTVRFFETDYFLLDFEPVNFELSTSQSLKDVLLGAIRKYKNSSLVFSVIIGDIITHHTLNATLYGEVNIAISDPLMLKESKVPDFSFYSEHILTHFSLFEIQKVQFSYG